MVALLPSVKFNGTITPREVRNILLVTRSLLGPVEPTGSPPV
jgi:hypothetical protein